MKHVLVLTLVLAACVDEGPTQPGSLSATEAAVCQSDGGRLGGTILGEACFRPTGDAGKQCGKQGECETLCLAETQTCAAETPKIGCFDILDENGTPVGLCVD